MRTILISAAVVACLSVSLSNLPLAAQSPHSANTAKYNLAVVDVSYVFKQHNGFIATMERMKQEMKTIETELKGEMQKIKDKEGQRDLHDMGTPDWKRVDNELTEMKADFTVKRTNRQKEFLEKESKVYYQTYLEVNQAVKYYAQRNDIGLVLRFNGEDVDPNRREDILRVINKPVVYQNQVDITPDVIALVNRGQPQAAPPKSGAQSAQRGRKPPRR